uniref:Phage protein n=1 Tax=Pseudomonas phage MK TaxID=3015287 RepID=A0AAT9TTL6_9VIRU
MIFDKYTISLDTFKDGTKEYVLFRRGDDGFITYFGSFATKYAAIDYAFLLEYNRYPSAYEEADLYNWVVMC